MPHAPAGRGPGPFDVLVLGSGVAGLSVAVRLSSSAPRGSARRRRVAILTKGELSQSATRWAQGGVAAVLGGDEDSTDLHLADTLAAGAGLCDEDAVRVLVDEGPSRVEELIRLGARFDREASGSLALAREGGHSRARVVHAGGAATGAEVERALVEATRATSEAVLERWFALELLMDDGRCTGVLAQPPSGPPVVVQAGDVVVATGGAGQVFAVTTNPSEATGDGIAMALRAGVEVADVEFVQFHPTALHHPAMPRPLLSEALRGHGALLRDASGERFVDELAPRDVVSRAMAATMADQGVAHLWLDATGLERFDQRFPTIATSVREIGLDPTTDWLPIAPAAHHLSGGILTDLHGAGSVPGLWAAGEAACTGVHGANRLASNSLLEGMVFGARVAERIVQGIDGPEASGAMRAATGAGQAGAGSDVIGGRFLSERPRRAIGQSALEPPASAADLPKLRDRLQRAMTAGAGVIRSAVSIAEAEVVVGDLADVAEAAGPDGVGRDAGELANLITMAQAVLGAALAREETRGAHARLDFPETDPGWRCRIVHQSAAPSRP